MKLNQIGNDLKLLFLNFAVRTSAGCYAYMPGDNSISTVTSRLARKIEHQISSDKYPYIEMNARKNFD